MTRKIVTSHQYPPIPTRNFDWCAHYDGEEEAGNYGWGRTEAEAIADFIENIAEDHDERLNDPRDSNAWDRIGKDPELANARRKLSIHEIRLIIQHAQARHDAALKAIIAEPFGCRFCDSGKLRNPAKDHDGTCGYAMAASLAKAEAK